MNLDRAMQLARSTARQPDGVFAIASSTLADEVDRLRGELLKANADNERLEAELVAGAAECVLALIDKEDQIQRLQTELERNIVEFNRERAP